MTLADRKRDLAQLFCKAFLTEVSGQPRQWRSAVVIAARAKIFTARDVKICLDYSREQGWIIEAEDGQVCLTEKGVRAHTA